MNSHGSVTALHDTIMEWDTFSEPYRTDVFRRIVTNGVVITTVVVYCLHAHIWEPLSDFYFLDIEPCR